VKKREVGIEIFNIEAWLTGKSGKLLHFNAQKN